MYNLAHEKIHTFLFSPFTLVLGYARLEFLKIQEIALCTKHLTLLPNMDDP